VKLITLTGLSHESRLYAAFVVVNFFLICAAVLITLVWYGEQVWELRAADEAARRHREEQDRRRKHALEIDAKSKHWQGPTAVYPKLTKKERRPRGRPDDDLLMRHHTQWQDPEAR